MRVNITVLVITAIISLACQREQFPDQSDSFGPLVDVSLSVDQNNGTRTVMREGAVFWAEGDMVSVFDSQAGRRFSTVPTGNGVSFRGRALDEDSYVVLYPYDDMAEYQGGTLATIVSDTQAPVEGGFDPSASLLCGQSSSGTVLMRHVCGILKLSVSISGVSQIRIISKDASGFCGKTSFSLDNGGVPSQIYSVSGDLKVIPASGDTFAQGKYYLSLAPCSMEKGVEIMLLMDDGSVRVADCNAPVAIERGKITELSQPVDRYPYYTLEPSSSCRTLESAHPRLFANDAEFRKHRQAVLEQKSTVLTLMHNEVMATAVRCVNRAEKMSNKLDASGKRMLEMARDAFGRIFMCAYAYRFTGESRFLECAEDILVQICSFPDWNKQNHYLDTSTLTHAAAVGYDWLYDSLDSSTKELIEDVVFSYSLSGCMTDAATYIKPESAWNTTVTSAMIMGAIAFHEVNPELCETLLHAGIEGNDKGVRELLGTDGSDHMGTMYWRNFAQMEMLAVSALRECFMTDFGISDYVGYKNTPKWYLNLIGNTGRTFAFGDNDESSETVPAMLYFSVLHQDPSLPYFELALAEEGEVLTGGVRTENGQSANMRTYPLVLLWASKYEETEASLPQDRVFAATESRQPVVTARTGWGRQDHYLAVKGGYAKMSHAHMDAGSFCYDAYGVRWATDPVQESYAVLEKAMAGLGWGNLGDYSQNSARWMAFRNNCRQHNTVCVNDKDHNVTAQALFISTHDTDSEIGGTLDLTATLAGEVASATRKAVIKDGDHLSVTDRITARSDKEASVRWNICTEALSTLADDGIILERDGIRMKLAVSASAGVKYRIWPNDPKLAEHPAPFCNVEAYRPEEYYCGYTVTVPAGETKELEMTIKRIK